MLVLVGRVQYGHERIVLTEGSDGLNDEIDVADVAALPITKTELKRATCWGSQSWLTWTELPIFHRIANVGGWRMPRRLRDWG